MAIDYDVYFEPWRGSDYLHGFNGRRFMILGESHYDSWKTNGQLVRYDLGTNFTRECVKEVVQRDDVGPFWRFVEQILLNQPRGKDGWVEDGGFVWDQIAFYNFLQVPVHGTAGDRPVHEEFVRSRGAFRGVIEKLRPECILVCGRELWRSMEAAREDDQLSRWMKAYRLGDDTRVWCMGIKHPSRGCQWRKVHPVLMAFLVDPWAAELTVRGQDTPYLA
jgi:hypothetical protein